MQQEAAHEFIRTEGHDLVAGAPLRAVVLPAEGQAPFVQRDEPLVGDGDAIGIERVIRASPRSAPSSGRVTLPPHSLAKPGASHCAKTAGSASASYSPKKRSWPRRCSAASSSRKRRRNSRESTRTGRKKPGRHATQRSPSGDSPPPGTMPCTCG